MTLFCVHYFPLPLLGLTNCRVCCYSACSLLAIPKCIEGHELLSVDLLYQALSASKQRSLKCASYVFLVLFSLLVVWQAVLGAIDSYTYEDQAYTIDIPYWPFYALMAFIGLVTTLQSLSLLWASLDSSQTKEGHS
ncbi:MULTISPECIES: TRAP transporter small permease [unclassified Oleiphilus]|uniref:TRAP transporter small permease n=1 Tax=unclassified Oleiphilus TaxID=2631174 RepID=UPI0009ED8EE8|nr:MULTISPECIES: TRAP transporter small permease subunit [unclassified Oleiphilus]